LQLDLAFDSQLTLRDVQSSPAAINADKEIQWNRLSNGSVRILLFGLNNNVIAAGSLFNLIFDVDRDAAPGKADISIIDLLATSPGAENVSIAGQAGYIDIQSYSDPTPPIISDIQVSRISASGATISWKTNKAATSQVEFGETSSYGTSSSLDSNLVTSHQQILTGLKFNTTYHFAVVSKDENTNTVQSDDRTFKTTSDAVDAPPTVQITAPVDGASVSGMVKILADASDDQGMDRVELSVDGSTMDTDKSAPYEFDLDTSLLAKGSHTICLAVFDTGGQNTSTCIAVIVIDFSTEAFRFVVMGDTRSGHDDHGQLISMVTDLDPAPRFVFNTGDITNDGNLDQWKTWQNIVAPLKIDWTVDPPQYVGVVGNHDTNASDWEKNWAEFLVGQQRYGDGKSFAFDYGNTLFIVLDSDNNTPAAWLEDTLKQQAHHYDWIFAFWHHPPYPFGAKDLDDSRKEWGPILQKYGAHVIFLGHAHHYARSYPMYMDGSDHPPRDDKGGIVEVITGGGGAGLKDVAPDDHGYQELLAYGEKVHHFCVIDVNGLIFRMQVIDIDGQVIDTFERALDGSVDSYPSINITSPVAGDMVSGTVTIEAEAADDDRVDRVDFYIDDLLVINQYATPYRFDWNSASAVDGEHEIKVVAVDSAGQQTAASIPVKVNNRGENQPPEITIVTPAEGETVSGSVFITAEALDDTGVSRVDFYIDNQQVAADDSVPYKLEWDTTVESNGMHELKTVATDTDGQTASSTIRVTVENIGANSPPVVEIIAPTEGSSVSDMVVIKLQAADDQEVTAVECFVDEVSIGHLTGEPFEFTWDSRSVAAGTHTLKAVATDNADQTGFDEVKIVVNNEGPPPVGDLSAFVLARSKLMTVPVAFCKETFLP
jgi:hypothetical protein